MSVKTIELKTKVWIIANQVRIEARGNGVYMTCDTDLEPVSIGTANIEDIQGALGLALEHVNEEKERHGGVI